MLSTLRHGARRVKPTNTQGVYVAHPTAMKALTRPRRGALAETMPAWRWERLNPVFVFAGAALFTAALRRTRLTGWMVR